MPRLDADAAPEPEPGQEPEPSSGVAAVLVLLDALRVAAEQPSGYDRDLFRHWTDEDGDGCDTRREVSARGGRRGSLHRPADVPSQMESGSADMTG